MIHCKVCNYPNEYTTDSNYTCTGCKMWAPEPPKAATAVTVQDDSYHVGLLDYSLNLIPGTKQPYSSRNFIHSWYIDRNIYVRPCVLKGDVKKWVCDTEYAVHTNNTFAIDLRGVI